MLRTECVLLLLCSLLVAAPAQAEFPAWLNRMYGYPAAQGQHWPHPWLYDARPEERAYNRIQIPGPERVDDPRPIDALIQAWNAPENPSAR